MIKLPYNDNHNAIRSRNEQGTKCIVIEYSNENLVIQNREFKYCNSYLIVFSYYGGGWITVTIRSK